MVTFDFEGVEMSEKDVNETLELLEEQGHPKKAARLRAFIKEVKSRLDKAEAKTGFQMGVGDGSGNLFVYGDHESIKTAQSKLLELGALRLIRERMSACRLGSLGMSPEESMNFSRMMDAVRQYDMMYRKWVPSLFWLQYTTNIQGKTMPDLSREQANGIFQRAKHYAQTGNMREAVNSVLSDFQTYGVGGGFIDILILSEAKNVEELEKALKGYCFWPK